MNEFRNPIPDPKREVAAPGLPVFNRDGVFIGLAASSFGQSYLQFSRANHDGSPVLLVNVEESSAFQLAAESQPYFGRIPKNVYGRPLAWLGAYGLEPLDREVARFLKLEVRSGAVVSEVLEGSPAEKAGLKSRDIILALDGKPLPRFKPDNVVVTYVEREIERHAPGDTFTLTVLRGSETLEVKALVETVDTIYVVVPYVAGDGQLSERELADLSGGNGDFGGGDVQDGGTWS